MNSSIITSFNVAIARPGPKRYLYAPHYHLLETLIGCSAHKVYIPYDIETFGTFIDKSIEEFPESLKHRVELIDKKRKTYNKVFDYLEPIHYDISKTPLEISYGLLFDFLYKIVLASERKTEADVSGLEYLSSNISILMTYVRDKESRIRLVQLKGLLSLYEPTQDLEGFKLTVPNISPSVHHRVMDFLDESEIIKLSEDRSQLGIPSKSKTILPKLRKNIRNINMDKYNDIISIVLYTIKLAYKEHDIENVLDTLLDLFSELLTFKEYSPPLLNLDKYRLYGCKKTFPKNPPNFVTSTGATCAMGEVFTWKEEKDNIWRI